MDATRLLHKKGAISLHIVCTHTLFSGTAYASLYYALGVEEIMVANTLKHHALQPPFTVLSMAPLLKRVLM